MAPDAELRSPAQEIASAAERATSLTRQLLAFSRKQMLTPKVVDLNEIVTENLKDAHAHDRRRHRPGRMVPGAELGAIKADPGQIEQVIMNPAVNARDAMPHGGKLTIETANITLDEHYARVHVPLQPGEYVMIAISDTGVGMDTETQTRIFEPFFTTKGPKGTGLGLSTVYGIIKLERRLRLGPQRARPRNGLQNLSAARQRGKRIHQLRKRLRLSPKPSMAKRRFSSLKMNQIFSSCQPISSALRATWSWLQWTRLPRCRWRRPTLVPFTCCSPTSSCPA